MLDRGSAGAAAPGAVTVNDARTSDAATTRGEKLTNYSDTPSRSSRIVRTAAASA
jgi:hypothetical protein